MEETLDTVREITSASRRLATLTGGRACFPEDGRSLAAAFSQVFDEISQQYTIGYSSNSAQRDSGTPETLEAIS
jgi:hypothetical protein